MVGRALKNLLSIFLKHKLDKIVSLVLCSTKETTQILPKLFLNITLIIFIKLNFFSCF